MGFINFLGHKVKMKDIVDGSGKGLLDVIYPVGAIYMSTVSTSPNTLFGGTWEQIKGRFLFAAGSNTANSTSAYGNIAAGSINRTAGETGGEINNKHSHYTLYSNDGSNFFAATTGNAPKSRTTTMTRGYWSISNKNDVTRQDSTFEEIINNMPPYLVVYIWKRTG